MKNSILLTAIFALFALSQTAAQSVEQSFYDTDKIQEVRIEFPVSNWMYLLDSLRFNGDGLLMGNAEINGATFENVGVRYEADHAFTPGKKRNNLFIQLNFTDEAQNLEGHTSLHFSNALRDPSMVREVLGFEIARNYMPAPRANFVNVYINDELSGLYANIETIDPVFLQTHFGSSDGAFFQARPYSQYDNFPAGCKQRIYGSMEYEDDSECYLYNFNQLSTGTWEPIIELTRTLNRTPEDIESILNVDRTLWMLAFNNIFVNLSSYSGQHSVNFFLFQDSRGIFQPIIWDLNLCFGGYKNIGQGSSLRLKQLQQLDPLLHVSNSSKPLISKLLMNETYRKVYVGHMRSILTNFVKNRKYEDRAKELQQLIQRDFVDDPNKFYRYEDFNISLYSTIGRRSLIPGLVELMDTRADFLEKSTELAVIPPLISETRTLGREQFSSKRVEAFMVVTKVEKFPKRVRIMYRFSEDSPFIEAPMHDDGALGDAEAEDGHYIFSIVPESEDAQLEYFIMAENASIMAFDPPNYMWKRHKISLAELNK